MTQMINNLPAMQETWIQSLGGEDPWRRERLPIPFLPEEFHGQGLQTLEDTKELDMPERLTHNREISALKWSDKHLGIPWQSSG